MTDNSYTSQEFTTNNWDTVFAISITDVNQSIVRQSAKTPEDYPTSWESEITAGMFSSAKKGSGSFGVWELTMGGSGTLVRMHVPVPECTISASDTSVTVKDARAYIEVHLNMLPRTSDDDRKLVVKTTSSGPDDPVVVVTKATFTSTEPEIGQQNYQGLAGALRDLLQGWFNENLSAFLHVFATVNLSQKAASGDFQWLAPTATSYAYLDGHDFGSSVLGVLCMTQNHPDDTTTQAIAPGAIPQGAKAGFSISKQMFLADMVLPHIKDVFPKADDSSFALTHNGNWIENQKHVRLDSVKNAGTKYHPIMTKFSISIEVDALKIYSYVHIPISPGIDAYVEMTSRYGLTLKEKDGDQYLTYTKLGEPDVNKWHDVADWVEGLEIGASVILAIAAAVASSVTVAVERVVVRVIVGIVAGGIVATIAEVLEKVPEWIAGDVPDGVPPINDFVSNAVSSTQWSDAGDFKLTSLSLNGALQLGGDPQFGV